MKPSKLTLIGALAMLGAWLGCGGDVVVDPAGPGSGGNTPTTSSSATGNGTGGTTSTTSTTSTTAAGPGSASSVGSSSSGGPCECGNGCTATPTPECPFDVNDPYEVCVAVVCEPEKMQCCAFDGCLELVACARETGCEGLECYQEETCMAEIDALGGITGEGVSAAQSLADCAFPQCGGCI
jgi:hypothetical protein